MCKILAIFKKIKTQSQSNAYHIIINSTVIVLILFADNLSAHTPLWCTQSPPRQTYTKVRGEGEGY
jgi:hypothetical protein